MPSDSRTALSIANIVIFAPVFIIQAFIVGRQKWIAERSKNVLSYYFTIGMDLIVFFTEGKAFSLCSSCR
jgi:hypothetical protein